MEIKVKKSPNKEKKLSRYFFLDVFFYAGYFFKLSNTFRALVVAQVVVSRTTEPKNLGSNL